MHSPSIQGIFIEWTSIVQAMTTQPAIKPTEFNFGAQQCLMEEPARCQHSVSIILAKTDRQRGPAQRTYVMYSGLSQALYSLKSSSQVALIGDVTNE